VDTSRLTYVSFESDGSLKKREFLNACQQTQILALYLKAK